MHVTTLGGWKGIVAEMLQHLLANPHLLDLTQQVQCPPILESVASHCCLSSFNYAATRAHTYTYLHPCAYTHMQVAVTVAGNSSKEAQQARTILLAHAALAPKINFLHPLPQVSMTVLGCVLDLCVSCACRVCLLNTLTSRNSNLVSSPLWCCLRC